MTRAEFMTRLKQGLIGLPTNTAADIVSDYHAHFEDGLAAGRTEEQVAAALGDPDRLARELRTEAGVRRWEQERNPSAAAGAVFAVLGLGAIDILILLPLLMTVVGVMLAAAFVVIGGFFVGAGLLVAGPFSGAASDIAAMMLAGVGVMAGSTFGGALLIIATILLVNGLVWFARLHYRLLKPALQPDTVQPLGARS